jgi:catechol-2,3-dioxygenase
MTEAASAVVRNAPNLAFSHMGMTVHDHAKMERFYTRALGFTVTDRGQLRDVRMRG